MGSSSSGGGGSSSSRSKNTATAAAVGSSLFGPVGGAISGGLAALSSRPTSSGGSSSGLSASQQQSIDALGRQYNNAIASGDQAAASAYHNAANQIRSQAGLVGGRDYDTETGEMYGGQGANVSSPTLTTSIVSPAAYPQVQAQQYDPTEMINQFKAAAKTEGPFENPDLVDDSENDNEAIE